MITPGSGRIPAGAGKKADESRSVGEDLSKERCGHTRTILQAIGTPAGQVR